MILNCKELQENRLEMLKEVINTECSKRSEDKSERGKGNYVPRLAVLHIGDDPASQVYMKNKVEAGKKCGIEVETINLEEVSKVLKLVGSFQFGNKMHSMIQLIGSISKEYDGVILQLPLPKEYTKAKVEALLNAIPKEKDVDGLSRLSIGSLYTDGKCYTPCTPRGIITIIDDNKIELEGKNVLIINRSDLVGKPLQKLMLDRDATVMVAHSKTPKHRLKLLMAEADIIVTAVGIPSFIDEDLLEKLSGFAPLTGKRVTIIDVSMNRNEKGKLCGDVVKLDDYSKYTNIDLTPVPNGVGRMTVLSLMENVVDSWLSPHRCWQEL